MTILDSNVWIAYAYEEDSQHEKAVQIFDLLTPSLVLPEYILIETCTVLTSRAGKRVADIFLDRALNNRDVLLLYADQKFFDSVISQYRRRDDRFLSFIDVSLFVLSQSYHVITFDKKLEKAMTEQRHT